MRQLLVVRLITGRRTSATTGWKEAYYRGHRQTSKPTQTKALPGRGTGKDVERCVSIGCINIVIAANAGGAFLPFGDITTLMIWRKERGKFTSFLRHLEWTPVILVCYAASILVHMWINAGTFNIRSQRDADSGRRGILFHAAPHAAAIAGLVDGIQP